MTFTPSFGRPFSPSFKPNSNSLAEAGDGWWNLDGEIDICVGAWSPKGAASSAMSLVDISGNGNDAEVLNAITWDSTNGWTAGALSTGIAANQTTSIIVRYSNRSVSTGASVFGTNDNSPSRFKHLLYSDTAIYTYFGDKLAATGIDSGTGAAAVVALCGQPSAGYKDYFNGTRKTNNTTAVFTVTNSEILLRCSTTGNIPTHNFLAAAVYKGSALTDTQVASISSAMAAL